MKKKRGCLTMFTGLLLIAAALFLTVYNVMEQKEADESSAAVLASLSSTISLAGENAAAAPADPPAAPETAPESIAPEAKPENDLTQAILPPFVQHPELQMPEVEIEGNYYIGVVEIPALQLALPVMSEWSYPSLKIAPCRYAGSVYSGDIVICGHNYDRHFGSLKDLPEGEDIRFTDMDGNVFLYSIAAQQSLAKTAVEEMLTQTGDWNLTLFTCTVGGKTRVTLRCKLESYIWNRVE